MAVRSVSEEYKYQKIARIGYKVYNYGTEPQQSIVSYKAAYDVGYKILLCDVRTTKDNEFVCLHDTTINSVARNSDGTHLSSDVNINDITLAETDNYDFGIYKGTQYKNTKILRLVEFLAKCKEWGVTPYLENKETLGYANCDRIVALVKQYGFEDNVIISGKSDDMRYFSTKLPNAVLSRWVQGITDAIIDDVATFGDNKKFIYVSNGYADTITAENYRKCLEKGVNIGYSEIRSEAELSEIKELGILKYCSYVATRIFDME